MEIIHGLGGIEKRGEGEGIFFLSSRKGGYLALGNASFSQYLGWFHLLKDDWELYKTIENISITAAPTKLVVSQNRVKRLSAGAVEIFTLVSDASLAYQVSGYDGDVKLEVDMRRIHDYDDQGRIYNVSMQKGCILIEYKKYFDNSLQSLKESYFLAIATGMPHTLSEDWAEKNYSYDSSRGIRSRLYTRSILSFKSDGNSYLCFGFSDDKNKAIAAAQDAFKSKNKQPRKTVSSQPEFAAAENAFQSLVLEEPANKKFKGPIIVAGYPWFYQVWSRDEIISSIGLISSGKFEEAKKILFRQLGTMNDEGLLPNRYPESSLTSADSVGWLFKRLFDLIQALEHRNQREKYISEKELRHIHSKAVFALDKARGRMRDGLVFTAGLETWMDTSSGDSDRAGARVEIQALYLAMYRFAEYLDRLLNMNNAHELKQQEHELKHATRHRMIADGILLDGIDMNGNPDRNIRPNVFLAYYVFPGLLKSEEWKKTFDKTIEECWLPWGGLSSIGKSSPLFQWNHTGIDNRSYHHGDSWYFLNNVAAIAMHDLDKERYDDKIKSIIDAGMHEMQFSGFLGCCAEISSASQSTSQGCLCQAWSAATLLELIRKMKK